MYSVFAAMCPSDLQQLWKEVSGVPSSEEALKQAEGLDLSTNSSNSTSAFPKAASAHIPLHSLANGQNHTPKRDRYAEILEISTQCDGVSVLCVTLYIPNPHPLVKSFSGSLLVDFLLYLHT